MVWSFEEPQSCFISPREKKILLIFETPKPFKRKLKAVTLFKDKIELSFLNMELTGPLFEVY